MCLKFFDFKSPLKFAHLFESGVDEIALRKTLSNVVEVS